MGGNLALLAASCGTALQPSLAGCILLLEDVGERPYRLDRMLLQCSQAGLFDGLAGIVFGEFTGCDEPDGTSSSRAVIRAFTTRLKRPAVAGLPIGHGTVNLAVPLGVKVRVDGDAGRLDFVQPLYPEFAPESEESPA